MSLCRGAPVGAGVFRAVPLAGLRQSAVRSRALEGSAGVRTRSFVGLGPLPTSRFRLPGPDRSRARRARTPTSARMRCAPSTIVPEPTQRALPCAARSGKARPSPSMSPRSCCHGLRTSRWSRTPSPPFLTARRARAARRRSALPTHARARAHAHRGHRGAGDRGARERVQLRGRQDVSVTRSACIREPPIDTRCADPSPSARVFCLARGPRCEFLLGRARP